MGYRLKLQRCQFLTKYFEKETLPHFISSPFRTIPSASCCSGCYLHFLLLLFLEFFLQLIWSMEMVI